MEPVESLQTTSQLPWPRNTFEAQILSARSAEAYAHMPGKYALFIFDIYFGGPKAFTQSEEDERHL